MNIETKVRLLVEEKLVERPDLFIISIKVNQQNHITVLLDGDEGVGIHDCALVSRYVAFTLESENFIENAYTLDVSSSGVDSALILDRQFHKNVGRLLEIKLKTGETISGTLLDVKENSVSINSTIKEKGKKLKQEQIEILKETMAESYVRISFK